MRKLPKWANRPVRLGRGTANGTGGLVHGRRPLSLRDMAPPILVRPSLTSQIETLVATLGGGFASLGSKLAPGAANLSAAGAWRRYENDDPDDIGETHGQFVYDGEHYRYGVALNAGGTDYKLQKRSGSTWVGISVSCEQINCAVEWDGLMWFGVTSITGNTLISYDGSTFTNHSGGPNLEIRAMLVWGDELVCGGNSGFGDTWTSLAQFNGSTWSAVGGGGVMLGSNPGYINALCLFDDPIDGELLVLGGEFDEAAGITTDNVAAYKAGTGWRSLFNGLDAVVLSLCPYTMTDGPMLIAGVNAADRLWRWNGHIWAAFGDPITTRVPATLPFFSSMKLFRGELHVAGRFQQKMQPSNSGTNSGNCNRVARLDGSGIPTQLGSGFNATARRLAWFDGELHCVGAFTATADGAIALPYAGRYDETAEEWEALGSGPSGKARCCGVVGSEFWVAGEGPTIDAWDGAAWRTVGTVNGTVHDMHVSADYVLFTGEFTMAGGTNAIGAVLYDRATDTWVPLGFGLFNDVTDAEPKGYACRLVGDYAIVTGQFDAVQNDFGVSISVKNIAKFHLGSMEWEVMGDGIEGIGYRLTNLTTDDVFVSGTALTVDGGLTIAPYVAQYDLVGDAWADADTFEVEAFGGPVPTVCAIDSGSGLRIRACCNDGWTFTLQELDSGTWTGIGDAIFGTQYDGEIYDMTDAGGSSLEICGAFVQAGIITTSDYIPECALCKVTVDGVVEHVKGGVGTFPSLVTVGASEAGSILGLDLVTLPGEASESLAVSGDFSCVSEVYSPCVGDMMLTRYLNRAGGLTGITPGDTPLVRSILRQGGRDEVCGTTTDFSNRADGREIVEEQFRIRFERGSRKFTALDIEPIGQINGSAEFNGIPYFCGPGYSVYRMEEDAGTYTYVQSGTWYDVSPGEYYFLIAAFGKLWAFGQLRPDEFTEWHWAVSEDGDTWTGGTWDKCLQGRCACIADLGAGPRLYAVAITDPSEFGSAYALWSTDGDGTWTNETSPGDRVEGTAYWVTPLQFDGEDPKIAVCGDLTIAGSGCSVVLYDGSAATQIAGSLDALGQAFAMAFLTKGGKRLTLVGDFYDVEGVPVFNAADYEPIDGWTPPALGGVNGAATYILGA